MNPIPQLPTMSQVPQNSTVGQEPTVNAARQGNQNNFINQEPQTSTGKGNDFNSVQQIGIFGVLCNVNFW